jgi:hypothetical protein
VDAACELWPHSNDRIEACHFWVTNLIDNGGVNGRLAAHTTLVWAVGRDFAVGVEAEQISRRQVAAVDAET